MSPKYGIGDDVRAEVGDIVAYGEVMAVERVAGQGWMYQLDNQIWYTEQNLVDA